MHGPNASTRFTTHAQPYTSALHSLVITAAPVAQPDSYTLRLTNSPATMPSQEAKLLGDFLLAPAPLRDFMTLRQFTDIFPRGHRENPAVQDLYRELHRLREAEIESVRNDITKEVKRSKQLRRAYAQERRQMDDARVAGTDPVALQMEEEVSLLSDALQAEGDVGTSSLATVAGHRTPWRQFTLALRMPARTSRRRSPRWKKRTNEPWLRSKRLSVP